MALNWSIAEVEDYEELLNEAKCLKAPYEMIVLATMSIGINEITESNWEEFFKRVNFSEKAIGTFYYESGEPLFIKEQDVKRLIGLHTNASKKTKKQFLQQFIHYI